MVELPLILLAGVLGSSHCLGMCGPFALTVGSGSRSWRAGVSRQIVYSVGRIFTYTVFGAVAGFSGAYLARSVPVLVNTAAILALIAGLFLIYQGLLAAGVIRRKAFGHGGPCLSGGVLATFLRSPGLTSVFLAGLFTGMLPCGLVYGFLALAASTSEMMRGAATMAVFGLGTVPVMMAAGLGGSLLGLGARRQLYRVAAWCVVVTGAISVARGLGFVHIPGWFDSAGCPLCQ